MLCKHSLDGPVRIRSPFQPPVLPPFPRRYQYASSQKEGGNEVVEKIHTEMVIKQIDDGRVTLRGAL